MQVKITKTNWVLSQKELDKYIMDPTTINLTNKVSTKEMKQKRNIRLSKMHEKPILIGLLLPVIALMILVISNMFTTPVNANNWDNDLFLSRFPLETRVIGCYNKYTKETREDYICTQPWDLNIKLPARSQIVQWFKYYNEYQIMNRLALINFESSFNIYASNPYAKWYIQTLRSYNIAIDIDSQLAWLKNRENKTYWKRFYAGKYWKTRWCAYYWNNTNFKDWFAEWEYGVLSCMYRYHYQANTGMWYAKRWITTTKFYKKYMFGI